MSDLFRFALSPEILSWTSTSILIAGAPYRGITALKYEQKRERKLVYGMSRAGKPLGRTSGKYTPGPGQITMLRDSYKVLTLFLATLGLTSYGDAKFPGTGGFPIVVKYEEPLDPTGITIVSFDSCAIEGESDDNAEGNDELTTAVDFSCLGIRRNGVSLFSFQRDLPL